MLYRIYGIRPLPARPAVLYAPRTITAEPVLHLALQHVARTPTARLGIVYQIADRTPPAEITHEIAVRRGAPLAPAGIANLIAHEGVVRPGPALFNLGNALYLDSILAGGVNGETLPLSIGRRLEAYMPALVVGNSVNLVS